jgi:hypothetical protein
MIGVENVIAMLLIVGDTTRIPEEAEGGEVGIGRIVRIMEVEAGGA